ncbi:MAG: hypothetical protein WD906_01265 [Anaerolineales bacterium]
MRRRRGLAGHDLQLAAAHVGRGGSNWLEAVARFAGWIKGLNLLVERADLAAPSHRFRRGTLDLAAEMRRALAKPQDGSPP